MKTILCVTQSDNCYGKGKTIQEAYDNLCETTEDYSYTDCDFYEATEIQVELQAKPTLIKSPIKK